ncbi:apg12-domain-containing protein [Lichtheimia corymbifera JMRC:FSU:9682]|uniref:Ubiquitin-like protein ATG12 n=1 Tax=Lichtheimia corymbifera JMRC:FSU:9682 TaxID=1263082 RepID=A0A068RGI4_9FUNG|nr:apg12-domain-containing protein [Lichtheimia corymbifera JMRC:FSU:9682]
MATPTPERESHQDTTPPFTFEQAIEKHKQEDSTTMVILRFRAIGNAPILKTPYRKVNATFTVQRVINFLRKELKYKDIDPLYVYINSAFAPAPDETMGSLFKSFSTDGQLIINYCTMAAWG